MTDVTTTITGALAGFGPQLLAIGGAAIGVGILVLALNRGWGLVKRFTK